MTKINKPRTPVVLRLSDAELARLDRLTQKLGETRTAVLRQAVRRFVELREKEVDRGSL